MVVEATTIGSSLAMKRAPTMTKVAGAENATLPHGILGRKESDVDMEHLVGGHRLATESNLTR